ncbi:aromatic-ring-hydroxylating dioxygenase subunit beta [Arthrobacter sp. SO3]|uniref:aromatic-ring-hydroxylating dioxygenase subunit beta n=1 Tax=Arthrobacter sp. SO3 TaxID=1897057 RepID=UPI001CFF5B82|nr:aromatic-ring-hydroxylating dioxygenase subunit beta [Arthrobacter sp. SO3]MCB5291808.1 3-phenylpropionate/cinnamic acid dioxygenase subunit beta [Arthrobacter sp. SO3]
MNEQILAAAAARTAVSRAEIEDYLYREAAMFDDWRLEEWLELFTLDCVYEVPATDAPTSDPSITWSLIHDRRTMLEQRVIRLKKPEAPRRVPAFAEIQGLEQGSSPTSGTVSPQVRGFFVFLRVHIVHTLASDLMFWVCGVPDRPIWLCGGAADYSGPGTALRGLFFEFIFIRPSVGYSRSPLHGG